MTITSETDSVNLGTTGAILIDDPAFHRSTLVTKENSDTTVVWNPWVDKARELSDLDNSEWTRFLCVETANVGDSAVHLEPGQRHAMESRIRVDPAR